MKIKKWICLLLFFCVMFSGCQKKPEPLQSIQIFAMDTFMLLKAGGGEKGKDALLKAEQEIYRLENLLSATRESSEVYAINVQAGKEPVAISEDTLSVLQAAEEISALTEGDFSVTIAPVVKAWGFTEEKHHVPTEEELQTALDLVDDTKLQIDATAKTAYLEKENMKLDLGGIAKGYTSDQVDKILKEEGITSAVISLGGNVSVIGKREDGTKWRVAVQDPLNREKYAGIFSVEDTSIITSGGYQRFFEKNGTRYHHIIDPKTGKPAETGLLSVTVVCNNGTKADGLSTSLFIAGLDKGIELWRASDDFGVLFITKDREIYITKDIAELFQLDETAGYTLHIVE